MTEGKAASSKDSEKSPAKRTARAPAKTSKTASPVKVEKKSKRGKEGSKEKVVRDSFTMPQPDYNLIADLKQAALEHGQHLKKSEILRAGLHALAKLNATQFKLAISSLEKIKTGRPKKS